jgi:hypothetical protein
MAPTPAALRTTARYPVYGKVAACASAATKAVAASHIVGVTLGECVKCGTVGMAQADADGSGLISLSSDSLRGRS